MGKHGYLRLGALTAVLLLAAGIQASAAYDTPRSPAVSYHYNLYGEAVPAPIFYTYKGALGEALHSPTDIVIRDTDLYVMDSGSGCVTVLDPATGGTRRRIVPQPDAQGVTLSLEDAQGMCVTEQGDIYICLYEQKQIAVLGGDGVVKRIISAPSGPLIPASFTYYPKRVAVQPDGRIFVVSEGTYQGIIQLDAEGSFVGFFGSNQVQATPGAILNQMWRKLFNKEQQERLENLLPVDYSSLTLAPDGFLYSTTANETTEELKKHGPDGSNILSYHQAQAPGVMLGGSDYGDLETFRDGEATVDTRFTDLSVSMRGMLYALDTERSRVFTYDSQSNLLGIFGGAAAQTGGLRRPVAVEMAGDTAYVLDQGRGEVLVFEPTAYAAALLEAAGLYAQGLFTQAKPYWETVRSYTTNLALCSTGLGWAALEEGHYTQALYYFEQTQDRAGYNQAFLAKRKAAFGRWAAVIFLAVGVAVAGLMALLSVKSRKGAFAVHDGKRRCLHPVHIMFHPSVGFEAMKDERMGSNRWALGMVAAMFAVRLLSIRFTGFLFNDYRAETINLLAELIQIVVIFAAWVICSWAVGTLMDSEGRMTEIFRASAYALCPYILCQSLSVVLSNVLVTREGLFIIGLRMLGVYWSAVWMLISIIKTHKFGFGRALMFVAIVLLGILFLLFLCIMFYTLAGQFGTFLSTIYQELQYRL